MTDVAVRDRARGGGVLELVDAFTEQALAIAASAAAPNNRRAYATAYRTFAAFLRERYGQASLQTFTVMVVAAWRDELTVHGLAATTVAQRVSAVRRLAAAIGADPLVAQVRCTHVQQERPKPSRPGSCRRCSPVLTCAERSASGTRDPRAPRARGTQAIRARAAYPLRIQERGRQRDPRQRRDRTARGDQTSLKVVVRGSKRGRTRTVPLHAEGHDALRKWYAVRPPALSDALSVSLCTRRSASPEPLSAGAVGDVVAKHAAAGVRDDRRTAHAPRHTFCTMLAELGVAMEVIRALAGHVDIRTTQIYVDVTDQRKADGVAALERTRHRGVYVARAVQDRRWRRSFELRVGAAKDVAEDAIEGC